MDEDLTEFQRILARHYAAGDYGSVRYLLGHSQSDFWGKLGITQSWGSKLELGAPISEPIRRLLHLQYVLGIDIDTGARIALTPKGYKL